MEDKYTIIWTIHTYGSVTQIVEKNQVKAECERIRKVSSAANNEPKNRFESIEVVNNNTGEIREYWNNHNNEIQF